MQVLAWTLLLFCVGRWLLFFQEANKHRLDTVSCEQQHVRGVDLDFLRRGLERRGGDRIWSNISFSVGIPHLDLMNSYQPSKRKKRSPISHQRAGQMVIISCLILRTYFKSQIFITRAKTKNYDKQTVKYFLGI
ncbi:unnamed protein product [Orchesella dallaii]|uniref:Secreted protein n=1 Tax=Orchesella dallaii TaxID=48710 RepID=A0ABP1PZX2_9HEXA